MYYSQVTCLSVKGELCLCRHHSSAFILPNVTKMCWHISRRCDSTSVFSRYFVQTREQRGQKDTLLFPEGPTGQFRDHIADAEEFQSLSSHGISHSLDNVSMGESSRKKNRTLFYFYIAFHCYHLPNLRMKSYFLLFSSRK